MFVCLFFFFWGGGGRVGIMCSNHTQESLQERNYTAVGMGVVKAFKTSGDLQKHVRTHTGRFGVGWVCRGVGGERDRLTFHTKVHTGWV